MLGLSDGVLFQACRVGPRQGHPSRDALCVVVFGGLQGSRGTMWVALQSQASNGGRRALKASSPDSLALSLAPKHSGLVGPCVHFVCLFGGLFLVLF